MLSAFIMGLAGTELAPDEAALLRQARPCGVILFARNAANPEQLRRLTDAAQAAVGEEILVLIDQEGGRVQRCGPRIGGPCRRPQLIARPTPAICRRRRMPRDPRPG